MGFYEFLTGKLATITALGILGVYALSKYYCPVINTPEDCILCIHGIISSYTNFTCGFFPSWGQNATTPTTELQIPYLTYVEFKNQLTTESHHTELSRFNGRSCAGCSNDDNWNPVRGSCVNFPNLAAYGTGARVIWAKANKVCGGAGQVKETSLIQEIENSDYQSDRLLMQSVIPGRGWAFSGQGQVLIRLSIPALIIGFTIHHPPKSILLPNFFASAPKDLEFFGLREETDPNPFPFGKFKYSAEGLSAQTFRVSKYSRTPFSHVRLDILSNHGNPVFSTLYRVEVYGLVVEKPWFLKGVEDLECIPKEQKLTKGCLQ